MFLFFMLSYTLMSCCYFPFASQTLFLVKDFTYHMRMAPCSWKILWNKMNYDYLLSWSCFCYAFLITTMFIPVLLIMCQVRHYDKKFNLISTISLMHYSCLQNIFNLVPTGSFMDSKLVRGNYIFALCLTGKNKQLLLPKNPLVTLTFF